jgi:hypothetical protein
MRATEWLAHDRKPDWLLRGDDLSEAEAWMGEVPARPQPIAQSTEALGSSSWPLQSNYTVN